MSTWIKCVDHMPPDNETKIIFKQDFWSPCCIRGFVVHAVVKMGEHTGYEWTPYNPELWKELNR